jgi:hypothetical protein
MFWQNGQARRANGLRTNSNGRHPHFANLKGKSAMSDLLSRMNGGELIGFFAVVGGLLFVATAAIAGIWAGVRHAEFRARQLEAEIALKQDMISRGMSADDIERVLTASSADADKASKCRGVAARG